MIELSTLFTLRSPLIARSHSVSFVAMCKYKGLWSAKPSNNKPILIVFTKDASHSFTNT